VSWIVAAVLELARHAVEARGEDDLVLVDQDAANLAPSAGAHARDFEGDVEEVLVPARSRHASSPV
jgi:hypothetical protein